MYYLLIQGGEVVDPGGGKQGRLDVAIKRNRIAAVDANIPAEAAAMAAGLDPGQVRQGLRASSSAILHLESFLSMLGHAVYYGEPLTYAAAILFEERGFSYVSGRRAMESIDREFRPGGRLHAALDGSTPFRQPEQWRSVRGPFMTASSKPST